MVVAIMSLAPSAKRQAPSAKRQAPSATPPERVAHPSGHAELITLRVIQRDRTAAHIVGPPGQRGPRLNQPLHVLADQLPACLAADLPPGHPYVEVDAVLGRLALRHALE